jgi:hypothetical protein
MTALKRRCILLPPMSLTLPGEPNAAAIESCLTRSAASFGDLGLMPIELRQENCVGRWIVYSAVGALRLILQ